MSKKFISAEPLFEKWRKNPAFVAEYDALEEEFALADTLIRARSAANMTQEDVARSMGTTQAAIARLEGGRNMPSTRTLQRYAQATGSRLRIVLEPAKKPSVTKSKRAS